MPQLIFSSINMILICTCIQIMNTAPSIISITIHIHIVIYINIIYTIPYHIYIIYIFFLVVLRSHTHIYIHTHITISISFVHIKSNMSSCFHVLMSSCTSMQNTWENSDQHIWIIHANHQSINQAICVWIIKTCKKLILKRILLN